METKKKSPLPRVVDEFYRRYADIIAASFFCPLFAFIVSVISEAWLPLDGAMRVYFVVNCLMCLIATLVLIDGKYSGDVDRSPMPISTIVLFLFIALLGALWAAVAFFGTMHHTKWYSIMMWPPILVNHGIIMCVHLLLKQFRAPNSL